jgi:hypothetical protein
MMWAAMEPGGVVWLSLAAAVIVWLAILAATPGTFIGPRRVIHWLLASWPSRLMVLAAWAASGWHIFCQRP